MVRKFVSLASISRAGESVLDLSAFIKWGYGFGPAGGLQAYRLVMEVIYGSIISEFNPINSTTKYTNSSTKE
jgi:hypothetical protein